MSKTSYFKPGDTMIVDGQKLLVKEGHCDDCFFTRKLDSGDPYCAATFKEGCGNTLGANLIVIPLKEGL